MTDPERLAAAIRILRSPEVESGLTRAQRAILNFEIDRRVFGIRVELSDRLPENTFVIAAVPVASA